MRFPPKLICLALALGALPAPAAEEADLVEKVAVRNRLYPVAGRWELGVYGGFTLLPKMTEHYNLNLGVAINVIDWLAIELRGGYAFTRHTGLADQVAASNFLSAIGNNPTAAAAPVEDMKDLWEMTGNAALGLRWQPIYGKISLFSEAALHFQAYLWVGGGAAYFKQQSAVICNERSGSECTAWRTDYKFGPVVETAVGVRLFLPLRPYVNTGNLAIALRVEARFYSWLDSYLVGINRVAALNPATPDGNGQPAPNPGVTTLSQIDIGPSFIF